MKRPLSLVALSCLVGMICLSTPSTGADNVAHSNPHGQQGACEACHDPVVPTAGAAKVGPMRPVVATCRSCHPDADMHPVDIKPVDITIAENFPLEHGRVTCATCHYEPGHKSAPAQVVTPWHRGGPYARTLDFCLQCHESKSLKKVDPHHPVSEAGQADGSCSACHTSEPTKDAPPAEAALRQKPSAVCTTCHEGTPHAGADEHLGKALQQGVQLPTDVGEIACFTCHDVHDGHSAGRLKARLPDALVQRALTDEWKALAGARLPGKKTTHPPMLAAPLEGGVLCETCHQEGP
ncbi:MAG: hypothetical protein ACI9MC_001801 [Kiritimatiellia bacterium]|jgi:hypothetical protein